MKKYITSVFIAILAVTIYAQRGPQSLYDLQQFLVATKEIPDENIMNEKILGSPFLNKEFREGLIHYNDAWYKDVNMRFDAVNDQMQAKLPGKGIVSLDPDINPIDSIQLNDELFVAKKIRGTNKLVYLVSLYAQDDVSLLKKHKKILRPEVPTKGFQDTKPAEYASSSPDYYLETGGNLTKIKRFSDFADPLNLNKKEVRSLTKKNNLKQNREEDLIQLIDLLIQK